MENITRKQVVERITECEKAGTFDKHTDPISYETALPVDENFKYMCKGFTRFKRAIKNAFIVKPFTWYINKFKFKTKVIGRKNYKGLKKAIITCNHFNKFDCLMCKHAIKHKMRITAADFNNQSGFMGEMMRVGGLMPFSGNFRAMKNFNNAFDELMEKNYFVLFYPEQAMWWNYEKPRPYKNGAYHYAIKYNVPILPVFITMVPTAKTDEEGISIKNFVVNIMPPIYPRADLNQKENAEYLKNENFRVCKECYEKFYDKKLKYLTITKEEDK